MKRIIVILVLSGVMGCAFMKEHGEAIGEGLKDLAPIVKVVPSPWGDLGSLLLYTVGGLIASYGGVKGYRHLRK